MVVDSQHRPWIAAAATATLLAGAGYAYYVASAPYGASGGSTPGLIFGIAGATLMGRAGDGHANGDLRSRDRQRRGGSSAAASRAGDDDATPAPRDDSQSDRPCE